ncbi:MAG: hypothetical protein JXD21_00950, partial [Candidatus Omnitrophica bacterium]|nr:hypothetical protein [Candidatus Omnitrophota bacterium]
GNAAGDSITLDAGAITSPSATTWALANTTNSLNIDSNTFVIDAQNDRLGIGTNSPRRRLDILDNTDPQLRLTNTSAIDYTDFRTSAAGDLLLNASGNDIYIDDIIQFGAHNTYDIGAAGGNRSRTGYFGTSVEVGNTHVDVNSLDFTGAGTFTSGNNLTLNPANDQDIIVSLSGTGDFEINTNQLYVDTNVGFIGINNTSPDVPLHTAGDLYVSNDTPTFNNASGNDDAYVQSNLEVDGETFIENGMTISGGTVDFPDGSIDGDDFQNNTIDSSEIQNNSLDFTEFEDTLDIDATTEINFAGNNLNFDLDSTGDFQIMDAGAVQHIFSDNGDVRLGNNDELYVDTDVNQVGFNDSTPSYTADINGTLRATGNADFDNGIDVTNAAITGDSGLTISGGAVNFPNGSIPGDDFANDTIDSSEIEDDSLDFTEFEDTLDLDATTQINLGANNFEIDLDSTGDFQIMDAGTAHHIFYDNGDVRFGNNNEVYVDTDVGRVGIGDSTPSYTLDVTGDIRATGRIYGAITNTQRDITTSGTGLSVSGGNDVLYGPDSDVTITLTTDGDILGTGPITVTNGTNVLPGSDAVDVSLTVGNDSVTDTHLAYDTGQHLTTSSSPTFVDLNSIRYIYGDFGTIARSTDEWLRLNQNSGGTADHTSGIYTPGGIAADGGFSTNSGYGFAAGEARATLFRDTTSGYLIDPASTSLINLMDVRGYLYNTETGGGTATRIADTLRVDNAVGIGVAPATGGFALAIAGHFGPSVDATYVLGAQPSASPWYQGGPNATLRWANFWASGTKSGVVETSKSDRTLLYVIESPEVYFEDLGESELINGIAKIPIETVYKETVNTDKPYQILITPYGNCKGLYIAERAKDYFVVKEKKNGTANIRFGYRIMALRKGYENVRFQDGHPDIPPEDSRDLVQNNLVHQ